MKNWNSVLLESIIRDALFEQASAESGKVVIRPMVGLDGERKIARAKSAMGLTDPVTDGFVVINKASSTITKPDIVNAIQNSREFGKGSIYDTENWVYLISNNRAVGDNSSKRDVLILRQDEYSLGVLVRKLDDQYNTMINSLEGQDRENLMQGLSAKYRFTALKTTAVPNTMDASLYFDTDIAESRKSVAELQVDIESMKRLGTGTSEYMKQITDLEKTNAELKRELETIKLVPYAPTSDEIDTGSELASDEIDTGSELGAANQESNAEITDVYNSSDAELISQLQRDIIKMVNNNPQIYPTDPRYKQIFDLFINRYKDDGRWGTNMSDMVELMNQGFEAGSSRSSITKQVYELIIKYQTDKL
jgi:hypothetical protein